MPAPPGTPGERIRSVVERHGAAALVDWCVRTLAGADTDTEAADGISWLEWTGGGPGSYHLQRAISGNPEPGYWPRVWAARALLYAWDSAAVPAVVAGLSDQHWRVREMCAKVAARHRLEEAGSTLAELRDDPVDRVRIAAQRAFMIVGQPA